MSQESGTKKLCQFCQWYQTGQFNTMGAGRVSVRVCTMPLSPHAQEIVGPHGTCDKFAAARKAT